MFAFQPTPSPDHPESVSAAGQEPRGASPHTVMCCIILLFRDISLVQEILLGRWHVKMPQVAVCDGSDAYDETGMGLAKMPRLSDAGDVTSRVPRGGSCGFYFLHFRGELREAFDRLPLFMGVRSEECIRSKLDTVIAFSTRGISNCGVLGQAEPESIMTRFKGLLFTF
jgi:hypothetical protein